LRAIKPVREHPGKMWRKEEDDTIYPYKEGINLITNTFNHSSPLQSLEPLWIQDASLEISRVKNISESNSISGNKVIGFEMPGYEGFDLNFKEDFILLYKLIDDGEIELELPLLGESSYLPRPSTSLT
jgi:CMP-N-acetylneuraminic acid synthetase